MNRLNKINIYLFMLPAILIGIFAMVSYGVAPAIWIQNILIWLAGTVLGTFFLIRKKENKAIQGNLLVTFVIVVLLALPFCFKGMDGVHRWLSFGTINIYISSIILPLLIIYLWKLVLINREYYVMGLISITLFILLIQPDAGQLTAFASAAVMLLWKTNRHWAIKTSALILTAVFGILAWIFLDDLAPVPYVEDMILLVAEMGNVWLILGILSLLLLLSPFFYYGRSNIISLSLGVYFLMTIIVTVFGNFPMPIMGYGMSPIVGYMIAVTWIKKYVKIR